MQRVLDSRDVPDLAAYVAAGGGRGLAAADKLGPSATVDEVLASGLRGRGGAGFPTGRKWQAVRTFESPVLPATVVVNAAEGEPGSFKDRLLLRRNPYRILEGALIAARAVEADRVVVAIKASFGVEAARLRAAIAEITAEGWTEGRSVAIVEGPSAYLYGEETALLEVVDGREPFPRLAPPFRHGALEVGDDVTVSAGTELAAPEGDTVAPPTLVNNTETMAHVALVLAEGADWFRSTGTPESPGTIVCTVTGDMLDHGVGEFAMGTPLREIVETLGREPRGERVVAVMSGVANPLLPAELLDTPATYEDMLAAGTGLGACGFIVFDDRTDPVAVALGVSRFLAVESCGQCAPCKRDGLAVMERLERVAAGEGDLYDLDEVGERLRTITTGARCYLAEQHQRVVGSALRLFPAVVEAHLPRGELRDPVDPVLIAPIVDFDAGRAVLDETQSTKQPDWTHDEVWSGQTPTDRLDVRAGEPLHRDE